MNLLKLSKYLAWELINKKVIEIPEFINMLENNIDIKLDDIKNDYDGLTTVNDYNKLLHYIFEKSGKEAINFILKRFWLKETFVDYVDLTSFEEANIEDLLSIKRDFLKEYKEILESIENSTNNKYNWNEYENLIEKFLLNTSYFNKWFTKEFKFEIWWQKIDKLLRLNKNILNINNPNLWYVIVEIKFKKDKDWDWENLSVNEVPQFESYIRILSKNNISKYWIFVCSNDFKTTSIEKFKAILDNENSNNQSFYISLITWKELIEFLENKWNYENMSFDEFIERSFIKWLK